MIQTKVKVTQKSPVNHDCYKMRLEFTDQNFEIKIGQSIRIDAFVKSIKFPEGTNVSRKYSIISPSTNKVHSFLFKDRFRHPFQSLQALRRIS
jgi:NAD(P)H-flavin reductase